MIMEIFIIATFFLFLFSTILFVLYKVSLIERKINTIYQTAQQSVGALGKPQTGNKMGKFFYHRDYRIKIMPPNKEESRYKWCVWDNKDQLIWTTYAETQSKALQMAVNRIDEYLTLKNEQR